MRRQRRGKEAVSGELHFTDAAILYPALTLHLSIGSINLWLIFFTPCFLMQKSTASFMPAVPYYCRHYSAFS